VDLNNTALQQLNNFYLNRSHHAQVVRNLTAMGVSTQLYDFIFPARSNDEEDRALMEAAAGGRIYFGLAFELSKETLAERRQPLSAAHAAYLDRTKWRVTVEGDAGGLYVGKNPLITFPDLASASQGLGFLNVQPDRDGVFRRAPLIVRHEDAFYPSLAFRAVCDYLGVSPGQVVVRPGKRIVLKNARQSGGVAHDIVIPVDRHGNVVINYIGPWERMTHYNFADVLRASDDREELALWREALTGRIAVIAEVSTGSSDVGPVPTDGHFPLSGLHANVVHTILTENFLREFSGGEMLLVEALLLGAVLALSLRFSSLPFSVGSLSVAVGYGGVVAGGFLYGNLILNALRPLLMMTFAVLSTVTYRYVLEEKEKWLLRRSFEAYFPPSIVKKIVEDPATLSLVGQEKEITILFSDIKSFSTHTATMTPEHIQRLLNEYFEAMTEVVFRHEGTVDKFIGDGLMAFWGDPEPQPDHALRAVRTAMDMQRKARELRVRWEAQGDMPLQVRIGVHTGRVAVGNMGSRRRLSYTALGADVNLAQRLESGAPVGGIMISQRTYDLVKDQVPTRPLTPVQAKGFEGTIRVYEVMVGEVPHLDQKEGQP
jgi:adenylate cyclase